MLGGVVKLPMPFVEFVCVAEHGRHECATGGVLAVQAEQRSPELVL